MSEVSPSASALTLAGGGQRRLSVAILLLTLYSIIFLVRPPSVVSKTYQSIWRAPANLMLRGLDSVARVAGWKGFNRDIRSAGYLVLMSGVVPLAATWAFRRSLRDVGTRWPNRYGLRLIVLSIVASVPFLVWMVNSPSIAAPYVNEWKRNAPLVFLTAYALNMLTEHFLIQGVVLGFCHQSGRWPDSIDVTVGDPRAGTTLVRFLRWLGLAQPVDRTQATHSFAQWLGLPPGCLPAILTSAFIFGVIHVGKDMRECVLSFPGGLAIAYIAYRTDSWLTPFFIHAATAGIAFAMMVAGKT